MKKKKKTNRHISSYDATDTHICMKMRSNFGRTDRKTHEINIKSMCVCGGVQHKRHLSL